MNKRFLTLAGKTGVFAFAITAAFAFKPAAAKEGALVDVYGVRPSGCEATQILCTTDNNGMKCFDGAIWLHNKVGTSCTAGLYERP